jgi:hypothetical protein
MLHELHNVDGTTTEAGFDVLLNPGDVARLFNVRVTTVRNWADKGGLFFVRTPTGRRRYPESCVRALFNNDLEGAKRPPSALNPSLITFGN